MSDTNETAGWLLTGSGLNAQINANGSLRRFDFEALSLSLFVGNELEGGPTNLYLRHHAGKIESIPLLGPQSPTRFRLEAGESLVGNGSWKGINYEIALVLARSTAAWFWHVKLENLTQAAQHLDLTYAQDVALAPYGAIRLNEFYVSQYLDHTPLPHPSNGVLLATRQNQAVDGRYPWSLIGSLRAAISFATDAKQFHGLSNRIGTTAVGLTDDLAGKRLQHEHALIVLRDAPIRLEPRASVTAGFFGSCVADHPAATSATDLDRVSPLLALPEARRRTASAVPPNTTSPASIFSAAPFLESRELDRTQLGIHFPHPWRHEETDSDGAFLSFYRGKSEHVVLKQKELRVLRPHGTLLRTGSHTTPDETSLTSTSWMGGVFHSMVTEGHVSINRFLSTTHSYLGLFRSHGQRVFIEVGGTWRLLNVPSAFEMSAQACRWIYRHSAGEVVIRAEASSTAHKLSLSIEVTDGEPARFLLSHHVALNDDDGSTPGPANWSVHDDDIVVATLPNTELGRRFPDGSFTIRSPSAQIERIGGDELLFLDGRSRRQPFVCVITSPTRAVELELLASLVGKDAQLPTLEAQANLIPDIRVQAPAQSPLATQLARIIDIAPWFAQNAWVHYLAPRGLEQYSGGGWGTRDVCQGPVELLLALQQTDAIRDLLVRVMRAQNPDGDWPQWFMFFERERGIRAGDSHGDIVFWPLVVLAQYLLATGDSSILAEVIPFFDQRGPVAGEPATVWQHVERALSLIEKRVIPGTSLAAYGHGDWNDSLQPADPALRERMCSAWTVTLCHQALTGLATALRTIGRSADVQRLETWAERVKSDFQRLLIVDGVLTGYAHFESDQSIRYLLHPADRTTGVRYSSLAMIHAILEDLLTPEQTQAHLRLIEEQLSTADGTRLFDRPMHYHGGPQKIFQRAETATFFGREIGLMYTHAHLRFAQALAHVGDAERFFHALCQASPIGIRELIASATLRQANCYYSSSDAAFDDRYQASAEYARIARGTVALDGGWRVYSSGAGIALGLIVRRFLGIETEAQHLRVDPVIPTALDGLQVHTTLLKSPLEVRYAIAGRGCGVTRIELNGRLLELSHESNPHRPGAVRVAMQVVQDLLRSDGNVMAIAVG